MRKMAESYSWMSNLVGTREWQDDNSNHQIGNGQRDDEPVGGRSAQLGVSKDGGHNQTVADNHDHVENDQRQHRSEHGNLVEVIQLHDWLVLSDELPPPLLSPTPPCRRQRRQRTTTSDGVKTNEHRTPTTCWNAVGRWWTKLVKLSSSSSSYDLSVLLAASVSVSCHRRVEFDARRVELRRCSSPSAGHFERRWAAAATTPAAVSMLEWVSMGTAHLTCARGHRWVDGYANRNVCRLQAEKQSVL